MLRVLRAEHWFVEESMIDYLSPLPYLDVPAPQEVFKVHVALQLTSNGSQRYS